ncbi:xanthine dehydrogenase family protein subunit M [Psychromarinibacter sp. C21-152]|uniref:Xanthine dehydrogenase family protein subunit M n=1 Tax=Psychromarinibacter sediminicola TaxID=3033385 RepID=A0AAE3NR04_9RHOB|nr:xanthine dehydrogenase family protein subunit M [Psychromarinibacter sediminicola]MDF0600436.1 xanthine dehydrogenase family protein subunit M [Psychromarinibacter sediminicola]
MYDFELVKPKSVDEAVSALAAEDAQPLGGGQTLIPTMKQRLAAPAVLVSTHDIDGMKGVSTDGGVMTVGGATTHGTVAKEAASAFPGLAGLAAKIGDPAVRNRGTIGGSLANNDPAACYPAALLAAGGTVVTNAREIAADDFFEGMFTTALEEGELITVVKFNIPEKSNYQKFEQPASRFPLVGVFVAKHSDEVRVGVTGASEDGVFRWTEAEQALSSNFSAEAISGLTVSADGMIGDLHGTPDYRAHLVKVMTGRAVSAAE